MFLRLELLIKTQKNQNMQNNAETNVSYECDMVYVWKDKAIFVTYVEQAGSGWNQFHPDPAHSCEQTCMTYSIAVCTVKNS